MAPESNIGAAKELTIRYLVGESLKRQEEIRSLLEIHFNRTGDDCRVEGKSRPKQLNVLDEIIDDLRELIEAQLYAIEFIASRINPKL